MADWKRSCLALLVILFLVQFVLWSRAPSQRAEAGALGSGTVTVTTPLDNSAGGDGLCSIREAINASNIDAAGASGCVGSASGPDRIIFDLNPGAVINIGQPLMPSVTETVEIDGGPERVELRGQGDMFAGAGIAFSSAAASGSVVRNLAINGFTNAIQIGSGVDGVHIVSNFIGTNASGTVALGNLYTGIEVEGPNSLIGGTDGWSPGGSCSGDCNLISANDTGIAVTGSGLGARIYGNMLGTDITGTQPLPNQRGILAQAANPLIGGPDTGEGNLISGGSQGIGVTINATPTIQGNFIGTDTSGTSLIDPKDFSAGIYISLSQNVIIGGDSDGARNVITYFEGVEVADSSGVQILGNFIGTAANGTAPLVPDTVEPTMGIRIFRSQFTKVGGIAPGERNVIANYDVGVVVTNVESSANPVRGNSIHSNAGLGIDTRNGGNGEPPPPAITSANQSGASGTASPPDCANSMCLVDIYSDSDDEGQIFEGSTQTDLAGNWTFSGSLIGPNVTATITNDGNNTSEFSAPFTLPTPTPTPSPTPTPTPTPTATPTVAPTATVTPTSTPTATASHSPSPSTSPSPTPTATAGPGTQRQWGDGDCTGAIAPRDSQAGLKHFLSQPELSQTEPCPDVGSTITFDDVSYIWGDWDCNGAIAPRDSQAGLKHFLSQAELSQSEPCPDAGAAGSVVP